MVILLYFSKYSSVVRWKRSVSPFVQKKKRDFLRKEFIVTKETTLIIHKLEVCGGDNYVFRKNINIIKKLYEANIWMGSTASLCSSGNGMFIQRLMFHSCVFQSRKLASTLCKKGTEQNTRTEKQCSTHSPPSFSEKEVNILIVWIKRGKTFIF